MIRNQLMVFHVPARICWDMGTQFIGAWFHTICKYMRVRHTQTAAYHSRSNGRAELAIMQLFQKFPRLQVAEPGKNWYHLL